MSGSSGRALEPLRTERMWPGLAQVGPIPFATPVDHPAPEHASITTGAAPMHLDDETSAAPMHLDDDDDARDDSRDARAPDGAPNDTIVTTRLLARSVPTAAAPRILPLAKRGSRGKSKQGQTRLSSRCRRRGRAALNLN